MEKPAPFIVIVDEDPAARRGFAHDLGREGYAVEAVASGREALALLGRREVRLVVADPGRNSAAGGDLLRRIRQMSPLAAVIVVTAEGTVAGAVEAMQEGASDYLLKPVPPEALAAAVRRALAGSRPPPPAATDAGGPVQSPEEFLTCDPTVGALLETVRRVAPTPATVLIQGESGTGKELLARRIHRLSGRAEGPYVAVNCAALPETLAESELFGHEKGAFTGAFGRKIGKFELARRGTLVLDEIGEMPLALQAKLLRALQEKTIDRLGGREPVPVDARIVAVTNRDLGAAVSAGGFREDLYYRIHVVALRVPPLRERPADVLFLAEHFRRRSNAQLGKEVRGFTAAARAALEGHGWKGNVRELENAVARAVILADGEWIEPRHLELGRPTAGSSAPAAAGGGFTVWEMERRLILKTLAEVDQNRTRAAEMLGISIRTLRNKLREYRERAGGEDPRRAGGGMELAF